MRIGLIQSAPRGGLLHYAAQLADGLSGRGHEVVLITARAQEEDKSRGRRIGVDAYLTKPFDPGEMIRVVHELAGTPLV